MPVDETAQAQAGDDEDWGFSVEALAADQGRRPELPVAQGVLVTNVAPGSPAERAGLQRGDVILSVRGRTVADPQALYRALTGIKPGESVPLHVHRGTESGGRRYLVLERPRTP
jgi:serine protease Do